MSTSCGITCHVLDSSRGIPGKNIQVKLEVRSSDNFDKDDKYSNNWHASIR